jgi:DNA-binding response OmpR family regulator
MAMSLNRAGRLLIVDDDEGVTQTFAGILRLEGHQVRAAANAFDGLREFESFHPDGIILDLRMPLINGLGFLYRLRTFAEGRHIPVAIITGDCSLDEESTNEIRSLGAELWMKPLWTEDLIVIADKLLTKRASTFLS